MSLPARRLVSVLLCALLAGCRGEPSDLSEGAEGGEGGSAPKTWEQTLDQVAASVVVLHVTVPRSFDTERANSLLGTGFVVDAQRGLILTNRHLVQPGPAVAQAAFLNHEEVDLVAVYRDPVHDFGFYRFDPADVRFMPVTALRLDPEAARVGLEIRVVGNDAGEKLSILSGTLARLDRDAPDYGEDDYNDFNTFYYQAASGTSGGSSGSPVVDIEGRVVALNAGGRIMAASSYYLPLQRVVPALQHLQAGAPIPRGTLETVFRYQPFDELRRLGLTAETERQVRDAFPEHVGMLVVDQVIPGGPAADHLEPGDILVSAGGELIDDFASLEARFDDLAGNRSSLPAERGGDPAARPSIDLTVERGGATLQMTLPVQDLHAITPDEYVEMGDGIVNPLSYEQARNHNLPVSGLYLAWTGYAFEAAGVPDNALLLDIGGHPLANLDAFWTDMVGRADGERVPLRWAPIDEPTRPQVSILRVDRRWFPLRRCHRDDTVGTWPCEEAPPPPPAQPPAPAETTFAAVGPPTVQALAPSLVSVSFHIPYRAEGVWATHFVGAGLVVDAEHGLVAVDRNTVPISLGDVDLTFAGSLRVPATVAFVHPMHNLALVHYDPALIGSTPVRSARLVPRDLSAGDAVWQVGLDDRGQVVWRQTRVSGVGPLDMPLPRRPQFREGNVDVIDIETATRTTGGVLADDSGGVLALWASLPLAEGQDQSDLVGNPGDPYFRGLPIELLDMVLEPLRRGEQPHYHALGADLSELSLADARERGLTPDWAARLEAHDPERRRVLAVSQPYAGFPAADLLRTGDLVLAAGDQPVTRFLELERAAQREVLDLDVLRAGQVASVSLPTHPLDGHGIQHLAAWAGALLHDPHLEVATQRGIETPGVYVAWIWYGSPAQRYAIPPTSLITAVDGTPTPDLAAFLDVVRGEHDGQAVRLRTLDLDRQVHMLTLELDLHYWPTREIRNESGEWSVRPVE